MQAQRLHEALFALSGGYGNYRATQPVGSRTVSLAQATPAPPMPLPPKEMVLYPPPMTERELRARNLAKEALRTAGNATQRTFAMDRRVQGSARYLERALAPR